MVLQAKNCPMHPAVPETSEIDLTPLAALVSLLFMWALLDLWQHLELAEEGQAAQGFSLGHTFSVSHLTSISGTLVNAACCALHIHFQSVWHYLPSGCKASSTTPHICLQLCPTGLQISSSSFSFHCWKAEDQPHFTITIYGCAGQNAVQLQPLGGNITGEAGPAASLTSESKEGTERNSSLFIFIRAIYESILKATKIGK